MELNVKVEKPSNITRKLTIKVPANSVAQRFQEGLVEVQRTAKLKGFRPGHVPMPVVKQYYGSDVRHRVFHNLIDESYQQAIREQQIQAVGSPQIEAPDHKTGEGTHDHELQEGKELTFTAIVEVLPELEVKGYAGISLTRTKVEVQDENVEQVIKEMLDRQAQLVPAAGGLLTAEGTQGSRPVAKGDFVDMAFSGGIVTETGIEERQGMKGSRLLEIGSGALIPGFEDNFIGMRQGETKTFRVKFPADFYEKDMAGKEAEFTVTLNEVKEKKLPELNDEFAKGSGYENIGDMRAKIHEHLMTQQTQDADRKLRSDLLQALIDKNSFEVPMSLVQAQTRALAQDVAQNLKSQGYNDQMIQEALASELDNLKKRAENQVRASLILETIAKKENITIAPEEVDGEISKMASSMKIEEEKVRDYYTKTPGRREDLEFRLKEDRAVQFLLSKAKIKGA
jgi:trigger factor